MTNLNRRKFVLNKKFLIYFFAFLTILISIIYYNYEKKFILKLFTDSIEIFSKNFNYQYVNLNINNLERVEKEYIQKKLDRYLMRSIFLLPFEEINKSLKDNNWIKKINLSTDYKNTLFVYIEEYKPLGIYNFNEKFFYFDENGKIIDELNINDKLENSLIIFKGKYSNMNALLLIDILNSINFQNEYNIKEVEFINNRRWDIILLNNSKLMLSEVNPKISLENFIKLNKKNSEIDLNNIITYDLRNINKTLITKNND